MESRENNPRASKPGSAWISSLALSVFPTPDMSHDYIPLSGRRAEEEGLETDDGFTPKQPDYAPRGFHAKNRRHIIYGLAAVAALILIFSFSAPHTLTLSYWRQGANTTAPPQQHSCGASPESAAEAGCTFDLIAFAWAQPACSDEELMHEFLARKEWRWWADAEGAEDVPGEEVALGSREQVFVSWEFQLQQCVYLWKKMQRAVVAKAPLDSWTLDAEHTARCGEMLLDQKRLADGGNTMIETKYTTCHEEQ